MAGFFINTNKVDEVADGIKTISDKCESVKSNVGGYDTSNEGGFDFSGAKSAMENNLEGAKIKFSNTVALLNAVVNVHGGIQDSVGDTDTGNPAGSSCGNKGCGGCSSRGGGCGSSGGSCGSRGTNSGASGAYGSNGEIFGYGGIDTGTEVTPSPYTKGEFVNFYQKNYNQSYGYGTTIANAGCGPTSMAMVLTYLLGETHDPVEIANWSLKRGYHVKGEGTAWAFFKACADSYGVECQQMGISKDAIINNLKAGKVIIMNVGPGHFTSGGHYIVLRGITDDGKIIVADPASEKRSNQVWDIDVFLKEGKQMWVFDGGKKGKIKLGSDNADADGKTSEDKTDSTTSETTDNKDKETTTDTKETSTDTKEQDKTTTSTDDSKKSDEESNSKEEKSSIDTASETSTDQTDNPSSDDNTVEDLGTTNNLIDDESTIENETVENVDEDGELKTSLDTSDLEGLI